MSFGLQLLKANGGVVLDSSSTTVQLAGILTVTGSTGGYGTTLTYTIPNFPAGQLGWCIAICYNNAVFIGQARISTSNQAVIEYLFPDAPSTQVITILYGWK